MVLPYHLIICDLNIKQALWCNKIIDGCMFNMTTLFFTATHCVRMQSVYTDCYLHLSAVNCHDFSELFSYQINGNF